MDVPRVGVDGSMASCLPILVISVYNDQQRRDVSLKGCSIIVNIIIVHYIHA